MKSIAATVDGHRTAPKPSAPSIEELKSKYADALAEWDATPPWHRPRWQVTPQGKALFFDADEARRAEIEAYRRRQAERQT
jgi:hypothetical protein